MESNISNFGTKYFFRGLGIETRTLHILGNALPTEPSFFFFLTHNASTLSPSCDFILSVSHSVNIWCLSIMLCSRWSCTTSIYCICHSTYKGRFSDYKELKTPFQVKYKRPHRTLLPENTHLWFKVSLAKKILYLTKFFHFYLYNFLSVGVIAAC